MPHHKKSEYTILRRYFGLLSLCGLICFIWLALIPSDKTEGIFLGYSPFRLMLISVLLVITLFFLLLFYNGRTCLKAREVYVSCLNRRNFPTLFPSTLFLLFLVDISFFFFIPIFQNGLLLPYYHRLAPIFVWLLVFCLSTPLCMLFLSKEKQFTDENYRRVIKTTGQVMAGFLLLWAIIFITKIGTIPDSSYWDDQKPVPLLEGQLFVVFLGVVLIVFFYQLLRKGQTKQQESGLNNKLGKWLILGCFLAIWLAAFLLWMSQPVPNCYFTPPVKPPNYEVYPYSDARIHDSDALGILLGEVSASQRIIRRPLYAVFLAVLHLLGGNNYASLVLLQTIVLALTPALIFLVLQQMGSWPAGLISAVFTIMIEWNTLQVASLTTTSNTKLLMTEWPAMLLIAGLVLALVLWTKGTEKHSLYTITVGGLFGALTLLRSQSLILIPFIILIFFFFLKGSWKNFLSTSLVFLLSVFVLIAPLLLRNWQIVGKITFEDPRYSQAVIQRFESQTNTGGIPQQEDLNASEADLFGSALHFITQNPAQFLGFVANNFFHNEILDIFIFPVRSTSINGLTDLFDPHGLFWLNAEIELLLPQVLLLIVYLFLLAIGIGFAYTHWKVGGLVPLIIHLAYNISNSVSRISGWRFILPVQWIIVLYFSLGIIQILEWVFVLFNLPSPAVKSRRKQIREKPLMSSQTKESPNFYKLVIPVFILLFFGLLIPMTMTKITPQYTFQNRGTLAELLFSDKNWERQPELKQKMEQLLAEGNISILRGKAFYPRFYKTGDGEPGKNPGIYKAESYPRLIFLLINDNRQDILLPLETSPEYFPNGSEVIVVGHKLSTSFETFLVNVRGERTELYFSESLLKFIND